MSPMIRSVALAARSQPMGPAGTNSGHPDRAQRSVAAVRAGRDSFSSRSRGADRRAQRRVD